MRVKNFIFVPGGVRLVPFDIYTSICINIHRYANSVGWSTVLKLRNSGFAIILREGARKLNKNKFRAFARIHTNLV